MAAIPPPAAGTDRDHSTLAAPSEKTDSTVLVVDLDGTLLKGDLLWESLRDYLFWSPWRAGEIILWYASGGKALLKARLAERVVLADEFLPWNQDTIKFCETRAVDGIEIVVATASNRTVAEAATRSLAFVSRVIGSDAALNLKGERKAARLVADFGAGGFDYIGDGAPDLPVWKAARQAWFVGSASRGDDLGRRLGKPLGKIPVAREQPLRSLMAALRPHQWVKNLLVFFPLLAAHRWHDAATWRETVPVFLALCFMASASYLLNDLADLNADRRHVRKRFRPFASGELSLPAGIAAMTVLLLLGVGLAAISGGTALAATFAYFLLSSSYSLGLKTVPVLEAIFLSGLYTYRMVLGGIAGSVMISPWLLAFSTTFFLGLAFLKRFIELDALPPQETQSIPRRGYVRSDATFVLVAGVASSFLSVVVLALYLESSVSRMLYAAPQWLWGIALVMLCWIIRVWFLASRKQMHDDPVWFAVKDPTTYALAVACLAFIATARPV